MLQVLLPSATIDQNIIKEDQYKLPQMTPKDMIHTGLESCWRISQSKGHYQKLKMPIVTSKLCLGDILLPHLDLMVPGPQINIGEIFGSPRLIHEFIDPGYRVPVLQSLLVQGPIINAHPQCAIFLLHQNHRRSKRTSTRPDVS